MATRHRLDHDLDPNQHRMLGARGTDLTITAGGDLTMGACNYANVTPAGGVLRRVQTVDWTQGSSISLRTTADMTIQHGAGAGSGFVGIATPDGLPFAVKAGDVVSLTLDGSVWCLPRASGDTYLIKARNADATTVGGLMEKTIDSDTITRELVTDPADNNIEKVKFNAVATRPSKIRYYLSDTHGSGGDYWTGHLLLTSNPYEEANAIDLDGAASLSQFVSAPGSPGLVGWPGGSVSAHLRIKLTGARAGRTYKLYTGNGDVVYTSLLYADHFSGDDVYQVQESAPAQPTVTEDYVDLDFDVPVKAISAASDWRLGLKLVLRAYVGDDEDTLDGETLVVRVGGDNASYLDTLFTPDGGFSGVHNDLDGRNADNAHPFAAITPGRVQTPANAPVTSVDGLFAVPLNSNFVVLDGEEDLIGCSTEGWTGPGWIEVHILNERDILKSQSPLPAGYAPFMWGSTDTGYGAAYDVQTAYAGSIFRFRWTGGVWRIAGVMNM